jgi:tetratricopeptide (TPR) repeat protein
MKPEPVSRIAPRRPDGCGPDPLRCSPLEYVEYSASFLLAAASPRSSGARSGSVKQALAGFVVVVSLGIAAAAMAAGASGDAGFFQESYDQEAMGKNEESLAALDKLSSKKSGSYVALLRRGWLQYRLGRHAAAVEAYTKAIAAVPRAVEPRLGILLPLLAQKQWTSTEKHARELLKLDPVNYLARLRLAFALYNQAKFVESRALYQQIVDGYPSDTEARSGLGWALLKLRRNSEAVAVFKAVLDFAPKNALAQQGLAALGAK